MLKEKVEVTLFFYIVLDVVAIAASFFVSFYLRALFFTDAELREAWQLGSYLWFLWTVIPLWIVLLLYERAYFSLERKSLKETTIPTIKAVIEGLIIILAVLFFAKIFAKSRFFFVFFGFVNVSFLLLVRWFISFIQGRIFRNPPFYHNVLIVGTGNAADKLNQFFETHSQWGVKIEGFLSVGGEKCMVSKNNVIGSFEDISLLLRSTPIDWVIFTIPFKKKELTMKGIKICKELGILASCPVSDYFPSLDTNISLEVYNDIPLLNFKTTTLRKWELLVKGIFDRVFSFIMLILLFPLFFMVAVLIKLTSKGPVFFRQVRCGVNGRKFIFYKFRTMVEDAEKRKSELTHLNVKKIVFKISEDPRITKIGRFLRKTSIDELPQLYNVFKGDMSLVGPRPPVPQEVELYEDWQRRRLSMKPGLTCLWQVDGRSELDFDDWMKLDLEYIDTWTLSLDMKILLRTIPAVLSTKGAY
ncbi:sugar transferase [candidate division WOR-3 bacterium]|nr:sugar transferase [candidate division WOR-3 bacterium]